MEIYADTITSLKFICVCVINMVIYFYFYFYLISICSSFFIRAIKKNVKINCIKLWKRWHDHISLMDLSELSGCLYECECIREREREKETCGHTLSQLIYLSDKIMECHLIYVWFPAIRLFLLHWASLEFRKVFRGFQRQTQIYKENIDSSQRHCVFASLCRIKNVAMTDIPLGGTKLRNALKRINKHASNFVNLLAQPFRRSLECEVYSHRTYCWSC